MAAYLVLMQEVRDVDRYRNEYVPRVLPLLQKYGAETLVTGFDTEPAEGAAEQHGRDPLRRHRGCLGLSERPRLPAGEGDPV